MSDQRGTGWLPDLIYLNRKFESGYAMFVDAAGRITRFSNAPDDLAHAAQAPKPRDPSGTYQLPLTFVSTRDPRPNGTSDSCLSRYVLDLARGDVSRCESFIA